LEAQEATANDTEITALMDQETAAQAAFDAAGARLTAAFENQKLHAAQQKQIQQQTDDAVVETHLEASKKTISIDESLGMSRIKIWASYAKYEAAFAKDAAEATLKVQREEAEREYQLKLQMLERMRAAEQSAAGGYKKAGDTDKENKEIQQVKETNAKIEALTAEHDAKLKQMAMETDAALLSLHANAAVMIEALTKRPLFPSLPQDTFNLLSMATAAERLGITLSTDLAKKAKEAQEAFALLDKEQKGGVISLRDLQSAQIKVMETQIQYDKEMGKAPVVVKAEEKALDDLKKKFDGLYPTEQKTRNFWDAFAADFKKKSHDVSEEASQMSGLMARAATQMDEAFASALMGALNSGKSIGAALEAATKQVLENLAEQALAHAIYCTAMGIAELALGVTDSSAGEWFAAAAEFGLVAGAVGAVGLAMPGGGGGGGGAAQMQGPSVGQTSSSTGGGGGSNQTTGVTHLAGGGIVTGPTRADIGENGEEAIIPLSDPEAMSRFAEAFTGLLSPSTLRAASGARAASSMMAASSMAPAPLDEQAMERVVSRAAGLNRNESLANVGGDTHVTHLHVKGLLDAGNLKKIIAKQNRMVQNRQVTVKSSDSLRITRRSQ
jgi:hypothetical protein